MQIFTPYSALQAEVVFSFVVCKQHAFEFILEY